MFVASICIVTSIIMLILQNRTIIQVAKLREDLDKKKEKSDRPRPEKVEVVRIPHAHQKALGGSRPRLTHGA